MFILNGNAVCVFRLGFASLDLTNRSEANMPNKSDLYTE
jgi:hypothetical protein